MFKIRLTNPNNLYFFFLLIAFILVITSGVRATATFMQLARRPTPPAVGLTTPQEKTLNQALDLLDSLNLQITAN